MNLKNTIKELSKLISTRKDDYNLHLANKLIDPTTSSKRYWSILKTLYNGRKIPIIFSLLLNDKLETDFRKKAHHFNVFSACTPIINNSVLPDLVNHNSTARLSSVNVNTVDILKIIKSLNVNKAHAHDNIFIRMIKLCGQSIVNSKIVLIMAFFLIFGKKSKIILVQKKGDKQIIDSYRPVSLLPICRKIFKKLLFNSLLKFLDNSNLLSSNQSGFKLSGSCEYQLLSIVHYIYALFDCCPSLEV